MDAYAYDPSLNLRAFSVLIQGQKWVLRVNCEEMFNVCDIGELAVLSIWVFFEWRNNEFKLLFRLDGKVPRGACVPSIRDCNNGLLIIVEKWYDNYQILITFIP